MVSAHAGDRQVLSIFPDLREIGVTFVSCLWRCLEFVIPMKIPSVLSLPFGRFAHAASVHAASSSISCSGKGCILYFTCFHFLISRTSLLASLISPMVLTGILVIRKFTSTENRKQVCPRSHDRLPSKPRSARFSSSVVGSSCRDRSREMAISSTSSVN